MFRLTPSLQKSCLFLAMFFSVVFCQKEELVSVAEILVTTQYIDVYCVASQITNTITKTKIPDISRRVLLIDNDLFVNQYYKYNDEDLKRDIALGCDDDDLYGYRHSEEDDGSLSYNSSEDDY